MPPDLGKFLWVEHIRSRDVLALAPPIVIPAKMAHSHGFYVVLGDKQSPLRCHPHEVLLGGIINVQEGSRNNQVLLEPQRGFKHFGHGRLINDLMIEGVVNIAGAAACLPLCQQVFIIDKPAPELERLGARYLVDRAE